MAIAPRTRRLLRDHRQCEGGQCLNASFTRNLSESQLVELSQSNAAETGVDRDCHDLHQRIRRHVEQGLYAGLRRHISTAALTTTTPRDAGPIGRHDCRCEIRDEGDRTRCRLWQKIAQKLGSNRQAAKQQCVRQNPGSETRGRSIGDRRPQCGGNRDAADVYPRLIAHKRWTPVHSLSPRNGPLSTASKNSSIRVTPFGYSESRVIPVLQSELRSTTLDGIVLRSSSL